MADFKILRLLNSISRHSQEGQALADSASQPWELDETAIAGIGQGGRGGALGNTGGGCSWSIAGISGKH